MDRSKNKDENLNTILHKITDYDGLPETVDLPTRSHTCGINCEVFLIGDSNLVALKPEIMNKGTICQKVICDTLEELCSLIINANFVRSPQNVYIQVGTDDIENPDFDVNRYLSSRFEVVLELVKEKLINSVIVVSAGALSPKTHKRQL